MCVFCDARVPALWFPCLRPASSLLPPPVSDATDEVTQQALALAEFWKCYETVALTPGQHAQFVHALKEFATKRSTTETVRLGPVK
jgi:hypothetical protein